MREQGADLESKRELYISQSRVLKDEISTIKSELRERRDRIEKLKVKYDLTVKAMGEPEISSELLPSHARHMVKVAQEKSELLGKYLYQNAEKLVYVLRWLVLNNYLASLFRNLMEERCMLDACLNICHVFGIWKYKHFDFPPKSTIDFIIGKK